MEVKSENPVNLLNGVTLPPILEAYFELCHLKQLYRQGWLRQGVPKEICESVAEHSFGVAVLALWLSRAYFPELDHQKVMQMALLHDLGEIYAGDITPGDRISEKEKRRLEERSIVKVLAKLPEGRAFIQVWEEFEQGDSAEARFIRQVDRLEMGLQAAVYTLQTQGSMQAFYESARQALSDKQMAELLEAAISIRSFTSNKSNSQG